MWLRLGLYSLLSLRGRCGWGLLSGVLINGLLIVPPSCSKVDVYALRYIVLYNIPNKNAQLPSLTTNDHASNARHSCRGCLEREERLFIIMGVKTRGLPCVFCSRSNGQLAPTRSSSLHHRVLTYNPTQPSLTLRQGGPL